MRNPPIYSVSVNQDFYQMHGTIDLERYSPDAPQAGLVRYLRDQYLLPYTLAKGRQRVAVLGAGGGMDVEAALLSGSAPSTRSTSIPSSSSSPARQRRGLLRRPARDRSRERCACLSPERAPGL